MQISMKSDINKALREVGSYYRRQVPYAAALAMTRTAQKVQQIERIEMQRVFNKPVNYTLNAQYVDMARKQDFESGRMQANVWLIGSIKRRNRHYLYPQVQGGQRDHSPFERLLIAAGVMKSSEYAIKTRYMNLFSKGRPITKGVYQKILSQLRASHDVYQRSTGSTRSRRNRKQQAFFLNRKGKPQGIWMRTGSRNGRSSVPAFIFVDAARYRSRFKFHDIATKVSDRYWPGAFKAALDQAIRTAR